MSSSNEYINLNEVTVSYEKFGSRALALDHISLSISKGEWVVIIGSNGSGKTTLLKTLSRHLQPDKGDIEINSKSIWKLSAKELTSTFFYVNQNPLLGTIPQLTVWENLIATDLLGKSRKESHNLYDKLLSEVSLINHKNHLVQYLSGGQRQILTLVIAKMRNPDVLLLDEPLAALDPVNSAIGLGIITKLYKAGKTILYVTHDRQASVKNGKRIISLEKGKFVK